MNIYQDKKIIRRLPTMSTKQLAEVDALAKEQLVSFDRNESFVNPVWAFEARNKIVHLIEQIEAEKKRRTDPTGSLNAKDL